MIDFSKAPEGATGYIKGSDVTECEYIVPSIKSKIFWVKGEECTWGSCEEWMPCSGLVSSCAPLPINRQLTVTCDNERIIREFVESCFKHEGDIEKTGYMWALDDVEKHVNEYLKPKKELSVPWEFIADWICEIIVDIDGCVTARDCHRNELPLPIKLDLDGVSLPVTVNRPE